MRFGGLGVCFRVWGFALEFGGLGIGGLGIGGLEFGGLGFGGLGLEVWDLGLRVSYTPKP